MKHATESLSVDGLNIRFVRQGSGPALVLVHGLLGYSFSWRSVIPPLAQGREVFAPDMPGAGFSDCAPDLDCHLSAAAARLLRFMDRLRIESCDLVGSSYGGSTALLLAAKNPQRVRTLTLVSPANPWSHIGRKRLAILNVPFVGSMFSPLARSMVPLHRLSVLRMFGDPSRASEETLHGYSLPLLRPGVLEHAVKITHSWHADMRELESVLQLVSRIPTLIVWGTKDRVVSPSSAVTLARHFKNSQTVMLEGAGHLPYEECPQQFAAAVNAFLAEFSGLQVMGGR